MPSPPTVLDELAWRGLVYQYTEDLPAALAAGPLTAYCGFDPTASSLHVGNLVPVMGLVHLQRGGHRPIAVVGGGTGLIGDPSGKSTERQLLIPEAVEANARALRAQLERFLDFGAGGALMRNNAEWLRPLSAIDFLREVGKHFTVNHMLQKDSVHSRLEAGISFTEFSYMLLQAFDYLELHRRDGAALQIGGSDQWGNITAGIELIRRTSGAAAHALTTPLVTTAAGSKFGKSVGGAVWLDPAKTSPYALYQFWLNVDDDDSVSYLKLFTFLDRPAIAAIEAEAAERPQARAAQRALAVEMTRLVHGDAELTAVQRASEVLFGSGDVASLSPELLDQALAEVPRTDVPRDALPALPALLVSLGLAKSNSDARGRVAQGGVYVNGARAEDADWQPTPGDLLHGRYLVLRSGKRNYGLVTAG